LSTDNRKRKIAVITGTRATYGYSKRLMKLMDESDTLELQLIVTGMHLLKEYGSSINEIVRDGFSPAATVDMSIGGDTPTAWAKSLGVEIEGMAQVFGMIKPDIVLLSGDRAEMFAAAMTAAYMNIPIAHIQSGDLSGHIDGSVRHAITKLAHIHLPACEDSAERVRKMGEEPWRIFNVGAPQLDEVVQGKRIPREQLARQFRLDFNKPVLLVIQHAVLTEVDEAYEQMKATMVAVAGTGYQTMVIYPNVDASGQEVIRAIQEFEGQSNIHSYRNIDRMFFLSLLGEVSLLVGNSSAGILEAPSFQLAAVNIGSRQQGRMRACNVVDVPEFSSNKISEKIHFSLYDDEFRAALADCENPYGDGHSSERIHQVLQEVDLEKFLVKQMTY